MIHKNDIIFPFSKYNELKIYMSNEGEAIKPATTICIFFKVFFRHSYLYNKGKFQPATVHDCMASITILIGMKVSSMTSKSCKKFC